MRSLKARFGGCLEMSLSGGARVASALLVSALLLAACDDPKEAIQAVEAGSAASTATAVAPPPVAEPAPTASAPAPKKRAECPKPPAVDFNGNAALEAEVRRKLAKDGGAIAQADLKKIKSVNLSTATVDELDPCIFPLFTGAKDIFLGSGELDDLTPLQTLTQLVTLRASINKVSDLHPLEKMTQLDRLDIGRTSVSDISPLANMAALTELQIDGTQVTDLAPLHACKLLEKLSIRNTPVHDLSPLKDARKLRFLYIEGAPIDDTNVLAPLVAGGLKIVRKGGA